ncbi:endonuclease III [soil metagenome]
MQPMPSEPQGERARLVLERLRALYPEARTELRYETPFELLVATILSAQATDVSVNAATPALFARYPDAAALAQAEHGEVEGLIRTIGLYRNKAKNIIATARAMVAEHGGEVPRDFESMLKLPGVGRKTANVVLSNAYGRAAIAVDTHVGRLARRLGFSPHDHPDKVEGDLTSIFPENAWIFLHHALILHGRRVCLARKPACHACGLAPLCPSRQD